MKKITLLIFIFISQITFGVYTAEPLTNLLTQKVIVSYNDTNIKFHYYRTKQNKRGIVLYLITHAIKGPSDSSRADYIINRNAPDNYEDAMYETLASGLRELYPRDNYLVDEQPNDVTLVVEYIADFFR